MSKLWRGVAAAALAAGLLAATELSAIAAPNVTSAVGVTIGAMAKLRPITGDVLVIYSDGSYSSAAIHGTISSAVSGDLATPFAQPFPYKKAPVAIAPPISLTTSASQPYSFKVTPTIATRYQVKISGTDVAKSAVQTVYVAAGFLLGPFRACTQRDRPICHEKVILYTVVSASAYRALSKKHWYFYFGLKLAARGVPGLPKYLYLDPRATITKARRISATKFENTISWSFRVNNDGYHWAWTACTKDSESQDGYGLPGRHDCGYRRLTTRKIGYLGIASS